MRRSCVTLAVLFAMTAFALPGTAKPSKRVVEIVYFGGGGGTTETPGLCPIHITQPSEVCVAVDPQPGERFIHVEFRDRSGQKVAADLMQGGADASSHRSFGRLCGKHERRVRLLSSFQPVQLFYYNGFCEDGTPSIVTTGTIIVTFSR